ncbi:DUF7683 domain-containing protein [Streptomyces humidus]|uniref:DUF7683 domain-containing protein n=1 Tax=Streptomyces humidus TaxID=52259 RepID=UPI00331B5753
MRFLLTRYGKEEDFPDQSTDVTGVGAEAFSALLGIPAEGLTDVYPLTQGHAERVRRLTGHTIDLEKYDYFLETESD